jgi:hypothetical protein
MGREKETMPRNHMINGAVIKFAVISFLVCHPRSPAPSRHRRSGIREPIPMVVQVQLTLELFLLLDIDKNRPSRFEEWCDSSSGLPRPLMHHAAG